MFYCYNMGSIPGIHSGVESMTLYHFNRYQYRIGNADGPNDLSELEMLSCQEARDCMIPMGLTSYVTLIDLFNSDD